MADVVQPELTVSPKAHGSPVPMAALLRLGLGVLIALTVLALVSTAADDVPGAIDVLSGASSPWLGADVLVQG